MKNKNISNRRFQTHPVGGPQTSIFLRLALGDEMMAADILTKEKKENKSMSEILVHGIFNPRNNGNNLVFYDGNEVRIENIIGKN